MNGWPLVNLNPRKANNMPISQNQLPASDRDEAVTLTPDEARARLMTRLYEVRLQAAEIAHGLSCLGDLSAGTYLHEAHLLIAACCDVMETKHPELG